MCYAYLYAKKKRKKSNKIEILLYPLYTQIFHYILNQIPNATSNTFLNNSKPTECRLTPFKPWLDKSVRHSIFEFERSM